MLFFLRTANICRPNYITILQSELDIYIFFLGSNIAWRGGGGCFETLPYSKFRQISWEQMMTEHRGLSVMYSASNGLSPNFRAISFYIFI